MGVTIAIVAGGVRKGIERTATWLMPVLFAVVVGLAIYAATSTGPDPLCLLPERGLLEASAKWA